MNNSIRTDARSLDAAKDRMRGDWDDNGTIAVVLPRDVAERLLAERGWEPQYSDRNRDGYGTPWIIGWWEPDADRTHFSALHDPDDALRLALTAENV